MRSGRQRLRDGDSRVATASRPAGDESPARSPATRSSSMLVAAARTIVSLASGTSSRSCNEHADATPRAQSASPAATVAAAACGACFASIAGHRSRGNALRGEKRVEQAPARGAGRPVDDPNLWRARSSMPVSPSGLPASTIRRDRRAPERRDHQYLLASGCDERQGRATRRQGSGAADGAAGIGAEATEPGGRSTGGRPGESNVLSIVESDR